MKKYLPLLTMLFYLFLSGNAHAQCLTTTCSYNGQMLISNANEMIEWFYKKSDNSFNPHGKTIRAVIEEYTGVPQEANFKVNVGLLIDLVKKAKGIDSAKVTGIRAYFLTTMHTGDVAIDTLIEDNEGELGIVWVPTKKNPLGNQYDDVNYQYKNADGQDETYCFYVNLADGVVPISSKAIASWKENFEGLYNKLFIHIGASQVGNDLKSPTKSVWYNIDGLTKLINYLECQICNKKINSSSRLFFSFAAYAVNAQANLSNYQNQIKQLDVSKQMTIVFRIPNLETFSFLQEVLKHRWEKFALDTTQKDFLKLKKQYEALASALAKANELKGTLKKTSVKPKGAAKKLALNPDSDSVEEYKILRNEVELFVTKALGPSDFDTALPCPPATTCIDLDPTP